MSKKIKKRIEPPPKDVFDPLTIETKKAVTVVLMLNSPEKEVLVKACEAIYKFALRGEENKATLLEFGAATKLLAREDKIVRRKATMIFGILTSNYNVRKLLKELDVINSVIALLAPEEEGVIHEFASLCPVNMSIEYGGRIHISKHGGVEPLTRLLSSPGPDVKKNSIERICNLVQEFECRATLQELNAIPPILDLLKSEYPIIQLLALKMFGVITRGKKSQAMLRDNQGLDHLSKILETKEFTDLHVEALLVMANCLEDRDSMALIQQTWGLRKLLAFMKSSTPDIQKNTAKAIARAARHFEKRKLLRKEEVEKCLVTLGSESDGTKIAASQAIAAVCDDFVSSQIDFSTQGIPQLVYLLKNRNQGREAAGLALAKMSFATLLMQTVTQESSNGSIYNGHFKNQLVAEPLPSPTEPERKSSSPRTVQLLCDLRPGPHRGNDGRGRTVARRDSRERQSGPELHGAIAEAGGIKPLTNNLSSKRDGAVANAATILTNMAPQEPLSRALQSHDLMQSLIGPLGSANTFVQSMVALAVAATARDVEARAEPHRRRSPSNVIGDGFYDNGRWSRFFLQKVTTDARHNIEAREGRGEKKEEKVKEEEEVLAIPKPTGEGSPDKELPSPDPDFCTYMNEVTKSILPITNMKEKIEVLAKYVAKKMGGKILKDKLHDFNWELHISELKFQLKSNVIPIGYIKKGIFYHALLFKALADRIGIGCSAVLGEYGYAWNQVKVVDLSRKGVTGHLPPPDIYIIDLMFHPGTLMSLWVSDVLVSEGGRQKKLDTGDQ
ncbi:LOW QUALITY PROTEIN: armadillo repeat-containing protein 3 [Erethizon dorsatum]